MVRSICWLVSGSFTFVISTLFGFWGNLWSVGSTLMFLFFKMAISKIPKLNSVYLCILALCIEVCITIPTFRGTSVIKAYIKHTQSRETLGNFFPKIKLVLTILSQIQASLIIKAYRKVLWWPLSLWWKHRAIDLEPHNVCLMIRLGVLLYNYFNLEWSIFGVPKKESENSVVR